MVEPVVGAAVVPPVVVVPEAAGWRVPLSPVVVVCDELLVDVEVLLPPDELWLEPELGCVEPELGWLEPELGCVEPELGWVEPELG